MQADDVIAPITSYNIMENILYTIKGILPFVELVAMVMLIVWLIRHWKK